MKYALEKYSQENEVESVLRVDYRVRSYAKQRSNHPSL
jgi:hypothetical protein